MYRYQTKHKILSLLLVFSLLILTTVLVFPSPALAQDEVWDCPDTPIVLELFAPAPQYCSGPLMPPLPEVKKLILGVVRPPPVPELELLVDLWPTMTMERGVSLEWVMNASWSSPTHAITVVPGPEYDIIEVTFDPPIPVVDQVCLSYFQSIPGSTVFVELLQLIYSPPNLPPVADADGPYSGSVGSLITFNGSASYDPDELYGDQIVSWEWEFTADGQYDDASGEIVQWSWGSPYSGFIGLKVTDTHGAWDTDEAEVNVTPAPTPPPVEVGGEVYPVSKLSVLAPWIVLAVAILGGATIVVRRRRAQD